MAENRSKSAEELAEALGKVALKSPKTGAELVERLNKKLKTNYSTRGIARGISVAVQRGIIRKLPTRPSTYVKK